MFNVGPMELLVLLVLALIVFGPAKLPEIFGSVGRAIAEFRRASQELTDVFTTEMNTVQSEISAIESTVEDLTAEVRNEFSSVPEAIQSPAVQSSRTTTAPTTYSTPIKPALNHGIPINTFPTHAPLDEHRPPEAFAQMISVPDAARPPPPFWAIPVPTTPPVNSTPPVVQEVASTVVDVDQTPTEVMQPPIEQIPIEATTAELVVGDVGLDPETPASLDGKSIDGIVAEPLVSATAAVEPAEAESVNREDSARGGAAPEDSVEIGESPSEHVSLATPSIDAVSLKNEPDGERSQDQDNGVPATPVAGSNGATKSRGRRPKIVVTAGE